MEYDPHTEQLTVRGPVHARLVLSALGVSYANSPKVEDPNYTYIISKDEIGPVVQALDRAYITDWNNQTFDLETARVREALFFVISRNELVWPQSDSVY